MKKKVITYLLFVSFPAIMIGILAAVVLLAHYTHSCIYYYTKSCP